MYKSSDSLAIAAWNIDGIYHRIDNQRLCKLSDEKVINYVSKFDIIGLLETHCGPNENLYLDNYYILHSHRKKSNKAVRYSGGIAVVIKNIIKKGVKILPITHSEFLWIKLDKTFFKLDSDIFLCFVYISPVSSSFNGKNDDIFELIENNIANLSKSGHSILMGDFNAHTNTAVDYIEENVSIDIFSDLSPFNLNDGHVTPFPRNNQDNHAVDVHGRKLLDLCKTCDVMIANGRLLGDQLGYFTCYNHIGMPSFIDYCLLHKSLLDQVKTFHVYSLNPFSIHCTISLIIKCQNSKMAKPLDIEKHLDNKQSRYKWSSSFENSYKLALSSPQCLNKINLLMNKTINSDQVSINGAVEQLTQLLLDTADQANIPLITTSKPIKSKLIKSKHVSRGNKSSKSWFDSECKTAYKQLKLKGDKIRRDPYNKQLINDLFQLRKKYKRLIQNKKRTFTNQILHDLDNLHDKCPNEFWKLAKKFNFNKQSNNISSNIHSHEWFNHFKSLMGQSPEPTTTNAEELTRYIDDNKDIIFNELNYKITTSETRAAILKLKNNKAAGKDKILNEFIKTGREVLTPLITKIFNHIFSNSKYPNSWNINILSSIYKKGDRNNAAN